MLHENKLLNYLQNMRLPIKLLIQGLALTILLVIVQAQLDAARQSFISYIPPIGLALLLFTTYLIQPLLLGVLNIFIINTLYGTKGWQVGFWLNGIFLLLTFTTVNLLLQTTLNLSFFSVVVVDVFLLAFPFGCIARFSNGVWKKPID
jgi:hypothetical protein